MISVSVIIPVCQAEAFIEGCVRSILGQSLKEIEVITVVDASPDRSGELLKRMASEDPRVRIIEKSQNGGVHAARLDGMRIAQGPYLAFADSDDWMDPRMLERLLENANRCDADIVLCGARLVTSSGKRLGIKARFTNSELTKDVAFEKFCRLELGTGAMWNKLIRRELALHNAMRDWGWRPDAGEDTLTLVGCFAQAQHVVTIPDVLYNYAIHEAAATQAAGKALNFARILRAYGSACECYQELGEEKLALIDELYRRQLNMPVYHVASPADLVKHQALLTDAVATLAKWRPQALYEFANLGISCPGSQMLHRSNLGKFKWALRMTVRSLIKKIMV